MASTDVLQPAANVQQSCFSKCSSHEQQCLPSKTPIASNQAPCAHDNEPIKKIPSLIEYETTRQIRARSLSHWPHASPGQQTMATAGWFSCNVHDRVICIYCHTICHGWKEHDNPAEVHARLAPNCPFVQAMPATEPSCRIINGSIGTPFSPHHAGMAQSPRRLATFTDDAWNKTAPSIEELARAGFFFSEKSKSVTCFYCNGSLHQWGEKDNPLIEHARWFSHCLYAKHLCGDDLHARTQQSKKRLITPVTNPTDNIELSRLVAARMDLPSVLRLRSKYQPAVIKRCIEDQWRIKHDDFKTDADLDMACRILQKQIDIIQGSKDKIVVPSANRPADVSRPSVKASLGECFVCLTEEKQLACMPCGHLCACVPCGYALQSCPICRQKVQAFVRVNV